MKRIVLLLISVLICGAALTGCANNELYEEKPADENLTNDHEIEDVYVGNYTTTNVTRKLSWNNAAKIELKGGKYTYRGLSEGSLSDIYNVSGNYSINDNKIIFEIKSYDGPAVDLMLVEGFAVLLLDGEYIYTFDGEKLAFSKVVISTPEKYNCEFDFYKK